MIHICPQKKKTVIWQVVKFIPINNPVATRLVWEYDHTTCLNTSNLKPFPKLHNSLSLHHKWGGQAPCSNFRHSNILRFSIFNQQSQHVLLIKRTKKQRCSYLLLVYNLNWMFRVVIPTWIIILTNSAIRL